MQHPACNHDIDDSCHDDIPGEYKQSKFAFCLISIFVLSKIILSAVKAGISNNTS